MRIGKIYIQRSIVLFDKKPMQALMKKIIVIRAEGRPVQDSIMYECISDMFEEKSQAVYPPRYEIIFTKRKNGTYSVAAIKQ